MNLIVLEGIRLYLFLVLILLAFIILLISLVVAIVMVRKNLYFERLLLNEKRKVSYLRKQNFILKLRHGELETNDE